SRTALHPRCVSITPDGSFGNPAGHGSFYSQGLHRARPNARTSSVPHTGKSRSGSSRRTRSWIWPPRRRIPPQWFLPQWLRQESGHRSIPYPTLPLLLLTDFSRLGIFLELLMELGGRRTFKRTHQFEVFMHSLVVAHGLLKIEFILFIDLGGKWGIGFLCALPGRALVVQVAGIALLDERKILSGFRERLARCNLFRFFKRFAGLAVNLPIIWACPMARFTSDTYQKLVWLRNFI